MTLSILTKEQDLFLREIAKGNTTKETTIILNDKFKTNFTEKQIKSYKNNHKIRSGLNKHDCIDRSKRRLLNDEQHQFLLDNCKGITNYELADRINEKFGTSFTYDQIRGYKSSRKIRSGISTTYKKGNVPVIKGTKGLYNVGGNKTSFKKGIKPHNCRAVGDETVMHDGYVYVKVANAEKPGLSRFGWKKKQYIIWEEAHGPIPENCTLLFLNGDQTDVRLENLKLVSKSERTIMAKHKLIFDNPELTDIGLGVAKIVSKTISIQKEKENGSKKKKCSSK